jgi:hypothetical protein
MPNIINTIQNPTFADFRDAIDNLHGNLKIARNAEQAQIIRAGRFAWIRSALNIGGARQTNAQTLEALKSALRDDQRYQVYQQQVGGDADALLGRARIDRPLSGARIRVLLNQADAALDNAANAAEAAANEQINTILMNRDECSQRLRERIQARKNPNEETLLNHPEMRRLNDRDFGNLMAYTREQMAPRQDLRNMPLETLATHCKNTLDEAIDVLLNRRFAVLSADNLDADQRNMLLANLMDDRFIGFRGFEGQLLDAREIGAQNAQQRQALARELTTPTAMREAIVANNPELAKLDFLSPERWKMLPEALRKTITADNPELAKLDGLYSLSSLFILTPEKWEVLPKAVREAIAADNPVVVQKLVDFQPKEWGEHPVMQSKAIEELRETVKKLLDDVEMENLRVPMEAQRESIAANDPVQAKLNSLLPAEWTALQQAFQQKMCLIGEPLAREHQLKLEEAKLNQMEFAGNIRRALMGEDAWDSVEAIQKDYPLEAAYLREKILRGEEIPADMITVLLDNAVNMNSDTLARIGEKGKDSPGALQEALLVLHGAIDEQFFRLPDEVRDKPDARRVFVESLTDILALRQEKADPGSARKSSARLLTSGASHALRTFVNYSAQNGGALATAAFGLTYQCAARALARQAGVPDADFDSLWEQVPEAASRVELPADTQALPLPVFGEDGKLIGPIGPKDDARIMGSAKGLLPYAPDPNVLRNLKTDIASVGVFRGVMCEAMQAMQDGIRTPVAFVNSQFYKDVDRGQETWLDGARVPTGGELPASDSTTRAERFYLPLLRFINPAATLGTASDPELAQMHVLASLFHQGLYGSVMTRGDQSLNAAVGRDPAEGETILFSAPMQGDRKIAISLDHAGDDLLLRVDYGQACATLTRGGIMTFLSPASWHSATATFTFPRAELERLGKQWGALVGNQMELKRLEQQWATDPNNGALDYAFNPASIQNARLEARATLEPGEDHE